MAPTRQSVSGFFEQQSKPAVDKLRPEVARLGDQIDAERVKHFDDGAKLGFRFSAQCPVQILSGESGFFSHRAHSASAGHRADGNSDGRCIFGFECFVDAAEYLDSPEMIAAYLTNGFPLAISVRQLTRARMFLSQLENSCVLSIVSVVAYALQTVNESSARRLRGHPGTTGELVTAPRTHRQQRQHQRVRHQLKRCRGLGSPLLDLIGKQIANEPSATSARSMISPQGYKKAPDDAGALRLLAIEDWISTSGRPGRRSGS